MSSSNSETSSPTLVLHNPIRTIKEQRIFKSEAEIETNYWFIIDGLVIDFSDFLWGHPGGPSFLKEWNHKDATQKFKYFGHSQRAWELVNEMAIGKLEKE